MQDYLAAPTQTPLEQKKFGLSGFQIKMIALIAMTIDHIAVYGFENPQIFRYYDEIRLVGRLAAPLFLFMLIESIRYTRNKQRLILRLYIAAVATGMTYTLTDCFDSRLYMPGNIMFTLFYTALYIVLIENIILGIKLKKYKKVIISLSVIAFTTVLVKFLVDWFNDYSWLPIGFAETNWKALHLINNLFRSIIYAPQYVNFSWLFILMGILLYFFSTKTQQTCIFLAFGLLSFIGSRCNITYCIDFIADGQFWMLLALPIYLLYNQSRGQQHKWFFYVYYPLHQTILRILLSLTLGI